VTNTLQAPSGVDLPKGHFIDGEWRSGSGELFPVVNPSDGELLAELPIGTAEDVDAAVAGARRAFAAWSKLAPGERERILRGFADVLDSHREELGTLESLDVGKPLRGAMGEASRAGELVRFFAGFATKNFGQQIPLRDSAVVCYTQLEPIGVIGAITPWNYPLLIGLNKIAPALAAGCAVVVKPPPEAPLSTLAVARIAVEAGLPEGLVNVVVGDHVAGSALAGHRGVAKLMFTGSTETGSAILGQAAKSIRPASLELGGKSPHIVFGDADLAGAADQVLLGGTYNSGQECCAGARVLVEADIYDEFVPALKKRIERLTVGPASADSTDLGPLISAGHRERVAGYVERAVAAGAEVVARGEAPEGPGFFFPPTVLAPVEPGAEIWCEEVFGPVITITTFDDDDDALAKANDTNYGLAAGVATADIGRAIRFSNELQAGMVWVNAFLSGDAAAPFGGVADSGFNREMGLPGFQDFCSIKAVYIRAPASGSGE
jgi:aminobutyraldehyde dehydrogenase